MIDEGRRGDDMRGWSDEQMSVEDGVIEITEEIKKKSASSKGQRHKGIKG